MLPFSVALRSGRPIYEQVIYAVTRAVTTGQLQPGDAFPSVRTLSQELKINPNTAHRIVSSLIEDGLLIVRPGIGTAVGRGDRPAAADRRSRLDEGVERLVVNAKRGGASLDDVLAAIRRAWKHTVRRGSRVEAP
jgi:GntR family transcriptional regulator